MPKFDLHITSIPDQKSRLVLARLIVGANRTISMHTALEMVAKPPFMLFGDLKFSEAEQHINLFKSLSVGFKVLEAADFSDEIISTEDIGPDAPSGKPADTPAHNADNPQAGKAQPAAPVNKNFSRPKPAASAPLVFTKNPATPSTHTPATPVWNDPRQFQSGVRIGSLDESNVKNAEENERKRNILMAVVITAVFLIFGAVTLLLSKDNKFSGSKSGNITAKEKSASSKPAKADKNTAAQRDDSKSADNTAKTAGAPASQSQNKDGQRGDIENADNTTKTADASAPQSQNKDKLRSAVSGQQKLQANNYIDSAKTSGGNPDKSIAFYKIAISFNRYNLPAWYGLLQAYRDSNRNKEARETEEQMIAIFGDQIMDVNNAVSKSQGELVDSYVNDDGVYRVEYKTRKRSKDDILYDVFEMTRSIRAACKCQNISVFASTGVGKGLIAHSTQGTSVHGFSDFSRQAKVVWLE